MWFLLVYRTSYGRLGGSFNVLVIFPILAAAMPLTVQYYYWCARFGGNATGHVIRGCAPPSTTGDILHERVVASSLLGGPWVAVAQNVDDDLTWTCPTTPAPEGFIERLRAVVGKE